MNNLKINGILSVDGMRFHDIEGGFGKGKKAILVKEIANIHNRETKRINELINSNRNRFKNDVDIVDLKGTEFEDVLNDHGIYNQNSINRSTNIYLLSERGYSKLLKIMDDDLAWEKYDELVDGYFNMRASKTLSPLDQLQLQREAILEVNDKVSAVQTEVNALKDGMPLFSVECKDLQALVKKIAIKALGGDKNKAAYKNKSIRSKVFSDIQCQLRRQFGVKRYEGIKRKDLEAAKSIVESYQLPYCLEQEVELANSQISVGGIV